MQKYYFFSFLRFLGADISTLVSFFRYTTTDFLRIEAKGLSLLYITTWINLSWLLVTLTSVQASWRNFLSHQNSQWPQKTHEIDSHQMNESVTLTMNSGSNISLQSFIGELGKHCFYLYVTPIWDSTHCLKISQNVAFEFFNFGIFHQFLTH